MAKPTTPPTTPPAIAPVLFDWLLESDGVGGGELAAVFELVVGADVEEGIVFDGFAVAREDIKDKTMVSVCAHSIWIRSAHTN
jgi:hypothetical protein